MTYILIMLTLWPIDGRVYLERRSHGYTRELCELRKIREQMQGSIQAYGRPLVLHSYCVPSHRRGLYESPSQESEPK